MKKTLVILLVIALAFGSAVGCAGSKNYATEDSMAYDMPMEPAMAKQEAAVEMENAEEEMAAGESRDGLSNNMDADAISQQSDRKLIYRAYYSIETTEFDADYALIMAKLESVGGYAQNVWQDGTKPTQYGDRGRNAEFNLRVPISAFDEFIASLEGVGNILNKNQTTDDVSAQYFDTEARIRVLNTQLERLEALLQKAEKLEDIIVLEQEITNVMYELDSYQGQKRQLDNLIDYTTISISLMEVNEITTVSQGERTLGQRIADSFGNVWDGLVRFFEGLLIVLVGGSPIWITLGIVAVVIVLLVKRGKKRKAKKDTAKPKRTKKTKENKDYSVE